MRGYARPLAPALLLLSLLVFPDCKRKPPEEAGVDRITRAAELPMPEPVARDLPQLREAGTLTVLAPYNSTTYFIYRGEPLGYEYELLREFAKEQGLALKMVVVADRKSLYPLLNGGDGDIAVGRIVPVPEDEQHV